MLAVRTSPPWRGPGRLKCHFYVRLYLTPGSEAYKFISSLYSPSTLRACPLKDKETGCCRTSLGYNKDLALSPPSFCSQNVQEALQEPLCPSARCYPEASYRNCRMSTAMASTMSTTKIILSALGTCILINLLQQNKSQAYCLQEGVENDELRPCGRGSANLTARCTSFRRSWSHLPPLAANPPR